MLGFMLVGMLPADDPRAASTCGRYQGWLSGEGGSLHDPCELLEVGRWTGCRRMFITQQACGGTSFGLWLVLGWQHTLLRF